jgi:hypothetical protein
VTKLLQVENQHKRSINKQNKAQLMSTTQQGSPRRKSISGEFDDAVKTMVLDEDIQKTKKMTYYFAKLSCDNKCKLPRKPKNELQEKREKLMAKLHPKYKKCVPVRDSDRLLPRLLQPYRKVTSIDTTDSATKRKKEISRYQKFVHTLMNEMWKW